MSINKQRHTIKVKMKSLEFIKQHVTEWPTTEYCLNAVKLISNGEVMFSGHTAITPCYTVDLSEHFAPSYYDGVVYTREEFESFGVVEYRYSAPMVHPLLKYDGGKYYYYFSDQYEWCEFGSTPPVHWSNAKRISTDEAERIMYADRPSVTPEGIDATVEERGNRYGTFKDGADIIQELKAVMRSTPNWSKLTPSQREALEMIQHKVGRILNGDPNYTDSWHDIKGYAHLIEEELKGNEK